MNKKLILTSILSAPFVLGMAGCSCNPTPSSSAQSSTPSSIPSSQPSSAPSSNPSSEPSSETSVHEHTWGSWEETLAATCETKGSHKRTCSTCNEVETEETSALGHALHEDTLVCLREGCDHDESTPIGMDYYEQHSKFDLYRGDSASFKYTIKYAGTFDFYCANFDKDNLTMKLYNSDSTLIKTLSNRESMSLAPGVYYTTITNGDISDISDLYYYTRCYGEHTYEDNGCCLNCGYVYGIADLVTSDLATYESRLLNEGQIYGFCLYPEIGVIEVVGIDGAEFTVEWIDENTTKTVSTTPIVKSVPTGSSGGFYNLRIKMTSSGKVGFVLHDLSKPIESYQYISGRGAAVKLEAVKDINSGDAIMLLMNDGTEEAVTVSDMYVGSTKVTTLHAGETGDILLRGCTNNEHITGGILYSLK